LGDLGDAVFDHPGLAGVSQVGQTAAGLAARGFSVGVGAREEQRRGAAVAKLRVGGADVFGVPLDVTDDASVTNVAQKHWSPELSLGGLVSSICARRSPQTNGQPIASPSTTIPLQ
jgi:short-subunit dehydrogenase